VKFEIDQSGKIEQTNKDTVLCISNKIWDAVLIKARTKRQLQEIFRRNGQKRNYVLFTFCAAVSLLLKRVKEARFVRIDREYFGKEGVMKKIIKEMLGNEREITFVSVGRQSHAHFLAKEVFTKRKKAGKILKLEELLREIKMTEVGKHVERAKRLKNA